MSSASLSPVVGSGAGESASSSLRPSSRGCSLSLNAMKVVLPDSTELELPDGATGLDAARAIGPKLAEQAVLVRSNGAVQDLRLPLRDGQPVQFLTTRDTADPDALSVLRHSTAHLLAEAVRHLYPGVKIAIGPPIENGFYYDFEFPEPIREEDLERLEQAKGRDLRKLGREPDLFHVSEESPGSPFWHPKGMVLWNQLEDLRRRDNARRGYWEVKTPLIYDTTVWVTSGHWEKFRDDMFLVAGDGEEPHAALKPMNCPGHMLLFGSQLRSYRDLPIRYAESSTLHRNELAGALHGLLRVRHVTQDDAHIFCTEEQVPAEIDACIEFVKDLYGIFGVTPHAELSTRPEKRLGTREEGGQGEGTLRRALERHGIEYVISPGEGTFYGPKIDLHMSDALGRTWQMGTIQADYQMPRQFGLTYMGPDNVEHTPVVIHRALLGSLERFIGIVVEHYGGAFPFWLAPVQVRLVPVGEGHREAVHELEARLEDAGFRVDVDERDDTL